MPNNNESLLCVKESFKADIDCLQLITPASLLRVGDKWQPSIWTPEIYSHLQTVDQGEDHHHPKRIIAWKSTTRTRDAGSWPSEGHHCPPTPHSLCASTSASVGMDILSPDCTEQLLLSSSQQRLCHHVLKHIRTSWVLPQETARCVTLLRISGPRHFCLNTIEKSDNKIKLSVPGPAPWPSYLRLFYNLV